MRRFHLQLGDVRWLPRIVGVLAVGEVLGQRLPLPRLARLLEGAPRPSDRMHGPDEVKRLVRLTQGLLRHLYRQDFCYPRSLILFHFLSRWGYPVRLHFGIRREGTRLAGHAWLELDEQPFAETRDPRATYSTTFTYPSTPTRSHYGSPTQHRSPQGRGAAPEVRRAEAGAVREAA